MNLLILLNLFTIFNSQQLNSGLDNRFTNNESEIELELERINNYFEKQKIIKTLENPNVSQIYKIELINNYLIEDTLTPNISKGGLYDDFQFIIN